MNKPVKPLRKLSSFAVVDAKGDFHVSVPALLAHLEVADTPENRDHAQKLVSEILREQFPTANIVETD